MSADFFDSTTATPTAARPAFHEAESWDGAAVQGASGPSAPDARATGLTGSGAANADIADLTFEQARDELSEVVARLEAGGEPLESSLELWERGEALAARCQEWLDGTRARFEAATNG